MLVRTSFLAALLRQSIMTGTIAERQDIIRQISLICLTASVAGPTPSIYIS